MKNNRQPQEITDEDFDSLWMWKVFWKLLKQETPFFFLLNVIFIAAFFMLFIFFHCSYRHILRNLKNKKAVGKSRAENARIQD